MNSRVFFGLIVTSFVVVAIVDTYIALYVIAEDTPLMRNMEGSLSVSTRDLQVQGSVGRRVPLQIRLRNDTKRTVEINDVAGSCSCTDLKAAAKTCPPGQAIELLGSIRLRHSPGKYAEKLYISFKDHPSQVLRLSCNAFGDVKVSTTKLNLIDGAKSSQCVTLTNCSPHEIKVFSSFIGHSLVAVTPEKAILRPGESAVISVSVTANLAADLTSELILAFEGTSQSSLSIPCTIRAVNPVTVTPSSLTLPSSHAPPSVVSTVLHLQNLSHDRFRVLRVRCPRHTKHVSTVKEGGNAASLEFQIDPAFWQSQHPGSRVLITLEDRESGDTATIPVGVVVNES